MEDAKRRKHRSGDYAVNVSTSISQNAFDEIEELSRLLGTTKADVVRRLILRGLVE